MGQINLVITEAEMGVLSLSASIKSPLDVLTVVHSFAETAKM